MNFWTEIKYLIFLIAAAQVIQTVIFLFLYKQTSHVVRMQMRKNRITTVIKTVLGKK